MGTEPGNDVTCDLKRLDGHARVYTAAASVGAGIGARQAGEARRIRSWYTDGRGRKSVSLLIYRVKLYTVT